MKRASKLRFAALVFALFVILFLTQLIKVLSYFSNPASFSFTPIIFAVLTMFGMLASAGMLVMSYFKKDYVTTVEDDEKWWERWDRV